MQHWKNYFFATDFSDVCDFLAPKEKGHIFHGDDAGILSGILQEHDPRTRNRDKWNMNSRECDFNVVGATVIYNGVNLPDFRSNARYSHVMILRFPDNGLCPQGDITLQYNHEV